MVTFTFIQAKGSRERRWIRFSFFDCPFLLQNFHCQQQLETSSRRRTFGSVLCPCQAGPLREQLHLRRLNARFFSPTSMRCEVYFFTSHRSPFKICPSATSPITLPVVALMWRGYSFLYYLLPFSFLLQNICNRLLPSSHVCPLAWSPLLA